MASRALNPLRRIASQEIRRVAAPVSAQSQCSRRSIASATGARRYPATISPAKAATTAKPAATPAAAAAKATTTTTKIPATAATAKPLNAAAAAAPRQPLPQTTSNPLPQAPETILRKENGSEEQIDWTSSYHGLGTSTFGPDVAEKLMAPMNPDDIEIKPDGIIYLPEIKYRRVLNLAFGPGGWGLAPRGDLIVKDRMVSRDYALIVHGR
jgi:hypothetical protein